MTDTFIHENQPIESISEILEGEGFTPGDKFGAIFQRIFGGDPVFQVNAARLKKVNNRLQQVQFANEGIRQAQVNIQQILKQPDNVRGPMFDVLIGSAIKNERPDAASLLNLAKKGAPTQAMKAAHSNQIMNKVRAQFISAKDAEGLSDEELDALSEKMTFQDLVRSQQGIKNKDLRLTDDELSFLANNPELMTNVGFKSFSSPEQDAQNAVREQAAAAETKGRVLGSVAVGEVATTTTVKGPEQQLIQLRDKLGNVVKEIKSRRNVTTADLKRDAQLVKIGKAPLLPFMKGISQDDADLIINANPSMMDVLLRSVTPRTQKQEGSVSASGEEAFTRVERLFRKGNFQRSELLLALKTFTKGLPKSERDKLIKRFNALKK